MVDAIRSLQAVPDPGFGERLRSARLEHRLTQAQLGAFLGVRQQTIGAWERGEKPQGRFLAPLAEFLELEGPEELSRLLSLEVDRDPGKGGPRTSHTASASVGTTADDSLTALANAVSARLMTGPPLSGDESAVIRELVAALRAAPSDG